MDNEKNLKFVNFLYYCPECKYKDREQHQDPCNDCLAIGAREGTEKPEYFEEA